MAVLGSTGDRRTRLGQINVGDFVLVVHPSNGAGGYDTTRLVAMGKAHRRHALRVKVVKIINDGRRVYIYLDPTGLPQVFRSGWGIPLTIPNGADPKLHLAITRGERDHEYHERMAGFRLNDHVQIGVRHGRVHGVHGLDRPGRYLLSVNWGASIGTIEVGTDGLRNLTREGLEGRGVAW